MHIDEELLEYLQDLSRIKLSCVSAKRITDQLRKTLEFIKWHSF